VLNLEDAFDGWRILNPIWRYYSDVSRASKRLEAHLTLLRIAKEAQLLELLHASIKLLEKVLQAFESRAV
jgi:hypothetical protein